MPQPRIYYNIYHSSSNLRHDKIKDDALYELQKVGVLYKNQESKYWNKIGKKFAGAGPYYYR